MRGTDLDTRIMDAAEQILKVNHGTLRASRLIARIMDDCCDDLAADVAFERVSAVLASAVTKKQLIRKSENYTLPPPPTPAVAYTPHATREAQQDAARRTQRQATTASRPTRPTPPAPARQPFTIPTAPATVKLPPQPAPPPPPAPPEPAPFIDMDASMRFTVEPITRATQPSLFDPTHPAMSPSPTTPRPRRRRAQLTPPDPRPLQQASLLDPPPKERDDA